MKYPHRLSLLSLWICLAAQAQMPATTHPDTNQNTAPAAAWDDQVDDSTGMAPAFRASPNFTHLKDQRWGMEKDFYHGGASVGNTTGVGNLQLCLFDIYPAALDAGSSGRQECNKQRGLFTSQGISAGSPWLITSHFNWLDNIYSRGIHQVITAVSNRYGVGDNAGMYLYAWDHNGTSATSDEGDTLATLHGGEVLDIPSGSPTTAGTGQTSLVLTHCINCNSYGDGRYAVVATQETDNYITGVTPASGQWSQPITVSKPVAVSTAWGHVTAATGNNGTYPNGKTRTMTVRLTSGAFTASGAPICVVMGQTEVAQVTAVGSPSGDIQSVTANMRKAFQTGAEIYQGGMCGYGITRLHGNSWDSIDSTHKTYGANPIVGSTDAHTIRVWNNSRGAQAGVGTYMAAKLDAEIKFSRITRSNHVVIAYPTTEVNLAKEPPPLATYTISSASKDSSLNGAITNFSRASGSPTSLGRETPVYTWSQTGPDVATENTATLTVHGLDNVAIYPMAEVIQASPYDSALSGAPIKLEYNTITLKPSDRIDSPNYFAGAGTGLWIAWNRYTESQGYGGSPSFKIDAAGYQGSIMQVNITNPNSIYQGLGGTFGGDTVLGVRGGYNTAIALKSAPLSGGNVLNVGCPLAGCNSATGTQYNLISAAGNHAYGLYLSWAPYSNTYFENVQGQKRIISPTLHPFAGPVYSGTVYSYNNPQITPFIKFGIYPNAGGDNPQVGDQWLQACNNTTPNITSGGGYPVCVGPVYQGWKGDNRQQRALGSLHAGYLEAEIAASVPNLTIGVQPVPDFFTPVYVGTSGPVNRVFTLTGVTPEGGETSYYRTYNSQDTQHTTETLDTHNYITVPCPATYNPSYASVKAYEYSKTYGWFYVGTCSGPGGTVIDNGTIRIAATPPLYNYSSSFSSYNGGVLGTLGWFPSNLSEKYDVGLSRTAIGTLALGNGTNGNSSGTLQAGNITGKTLQINGNTSGSIQLNAASTTATYSLKFPPAQGNANSVPMNDGSGNLSWADLKAYTPQVFANLTKSQTLKSGSYQNHVTCNGAVILTLPLASSLAGQTWHIINMNASNPCTIVSISTIGNLSPSTTQTIPPGDSVQLASDGSVWRIEQ